MQRLGARHFFVTAANLEFEVSAEDLCSLLFDARYERLDGARLRGRLIERLPYLPV